MKKFNAGNRGPAVKKWRGYSLEELRYRRVLNEVEIAVEKDKLMRCVSGASHRDQTATSMLAKAIRALSCFDYVILAFKIATRMVKLYRALKRK